MYNYILESSRKVCINHPLDILYTNLLYCIEITHIRETRGELFHLTFGGGSHPELEPTILLYTSKANILRAISNIMFSGCGSLFFSFYPLNIEKKRSCQLELATDKEMYRDTFLRCSLS